MAFTSIAGEFFFFQAHDAMKRNVVHYSRYVGRDFIKLYTFFLENLEYIRN